MPRMSLADILIGTTSLTQEQLLRAEALSAQRGVRLEEVLVQQHFLSEEELLQVQGQQLGMPYWKELPESEFDVSLMTQIPLPFARQHKLVPIRKQDGIVLVAMSQALNLQPLDDVSALLKAPVEPILSPRSFKIWTHRRWVAWPMTWKGRKIFWITTPRRPSFSSSI